MHCKSTHALLQAHIVVQLPVVCAQGSEFFTQGLRILVHLFKVAPGGQHAGPKVRSVIHALS